MSLTLILIMAIMGFSILAFQDNNLRERYLFYPYLMRSDRSYWRFLSCGFVHADYMHLFMNCYVMYIIGERLEYQFIAIFGDAQGKVFYLLFFILSVILSSIPSYFKHINNPAYRALGASGATSALVFSYILFYPWEWFLFPPMPGILLGPAFLWYSSYMEKQNNDNIEHNTHFWGAIFGFVFTNLLLGILTPNTLKYLWAEIIPF